MDSPLRDWDDLTTAGEWRALLSAWSSAILKDPEVLEKMPPEVAASGWLGFDGASETQIAQLEERIGVALPPSYRLFLGVSNGWRSIDRAIHSIFPADRVDWFDALNHEWIEEWIDAASDFGGGFQDPTVEHLPRTLQISDVGDVAVCLLNPLVVDTNGEWEAWFFSNWNPGADRYPSFASLMLARYESYMYLLNALESGGSAR